MQSFQSSPMQMQINDTKSSDLESQSKHHSLQRPSSLLLPIEPQGIVGENDSIKQLPLVPPDEIQQEEVILEDSPFLSEVFNQTQEEKSNSQHELTQDGVLNLQHQCIPEMNMSQPREPIFSDGVQNVIEDIPNCKLNGLKEYPLQLLQEQNVQLEKHEHDISPKDNAVVIDSLQFSEDSSHISNAPGEIITVDEPSVSPFQSTPIALPQPHTNFISPERIVSDSNYKDIPITSNIDSIKAVSVDSLSVDEHVDFRNIVIDSATAAKIDPEDQLRSQINQSIHPQSPPKFVASKRSASTFASLNQTLQPKIVQGSNLHHEQNIPQQSIEVSKLNQPCERTSADLSGAHQHDLNIINENIIEMNPPKYLSKQSESKSNSITVPHPQAIITNLISSEKLESSGDEVNFSNIDSSKAVPVIPLTLDEQVQDNIASDLTAKPTIDPIFNADTSSQNFHLDKSIPPLPPPKFVAPKRSVTIFTSLNQTSQPDINQVCNQPQEKLSILQQQLNHVNMIQQREAIPVDGLPIVPVNESDSLNAYETMTNLITSGSSLNSAEDRTSISNVDSPNDALPVAENNRFQNTNDTDSSEIAKIDPKSTTDISSQSQLNPQPNQSIPPLPPVKFAAPKRSVSTYIKLRPDFQAPLSGDVENSHAQTQVNVSVDKSPPKFVAPRRTISSTFKSVNDSSFAMSNTSSHAASKSSLNSHANRLYENSTYISEATQSYYSAAYEVSSSEHQYNLRSVKSSDANLKIIHATIF